MNERLTCTKLIAVDRLGSEVWVSSNFQKKIPRLVGRLGSGPRVVG